MQTAPSAKRTRPLIIGVDTGKTAALASLDLSGETVRISSHRYGGLEWFVDEIKRSGTPVVIASDKRRATETVSKLATIFDAVLFTPQYDISVKKKMPLVNAPQVENLHGRDALSAAKAAYNSYRNKLSQAERIAKDNRYDDVEGLKAMVIRKYSIHDVINRAKSGRRMVR